MSFRPTQVHENRLKGTGFSPYINQAELMRLLAAEGNDFRQSVSGFPVTQHQTGPRVRLSVRKAAWSVTTPPTSTGNQGEAPPLLFRQS
jgi:hypothetical protein